VHDIAQASPHHLRSGLGMWCPRHLQAGSGRSVLHSSSVGAIGLALNKSNPGREGAIELFHGIRDAFFVL